MPRPRPNRPRQAQPESAADLVSAVVARLGGQARALEQRVFEAYNLAAGAMLLRRSQPERLRGTTLFVRVASSAVAHELTLLRAEIVERMGQSLGAGAVTDLRTRVAPLRAGH